MTYRVFGTWPEEHDESVADLGEALERARALVDAHPRATVQVIGPGISASLFQPEEEQNE